MRRWAARTALGLLVLAALACQIPLAEPPTDGKYPVTYPAMAVYLDSGEATVLLQPCPQDHIVWIQLTQRHPITPGPSPVDPENAATWRLVNSADAAVPAQLRLLDHPAGWTEATVQTRPITHMLDGELYILSLYGYLNASSSPTAPDSPDAIDFLDFTMQDLRSLPGGQVWTRTTTAEARPISRDAFAANASAVCSNSSRLPPRT